MASIASWVCPGSLTDHLDAHAALTSSFSQAHKSGHDLAQPLLLPSPLSGPGPIHVQWSHALSLPPLLELLYAPCLYVPPISYTLKFFCLMFSQFHVWVHAEKEHIPTGTLISPHSTIQKSWLDLSNAWGEELKRYVTNVSFELNSSVWQRYLQPIAALTVWLQEHLTNMDNRSPLRDCLEPLLSMVSRKIGNETMLLEPHY